LDSTNGLFKTHSPHHNILATTLNRNQGKEMNKVLWDFGRAEALSWAQEAGFPAALKKKGKAKP